MTSDSGVYSYIERTPASCTVLGVSRYRRRLWESSGGWYHGCRLQEESQKAISAASTRSEVRDLLESQPSRTPFKFPAVSPQILPRSPS